MKKIAVLPLWVTLVGCATVPGTRPGVALEFRPGSLAPAAGLTEMTVAGSGQKVYLSNETVLSNDDVKSSRVVPGAYGPQVEIVFTKAGADKFTRVTERSLMQPLGILVDGQLVSAPIVRETIRSSRALISGNFSDAEARRIAEGIGRK